ncbi:uncharacterized protein BHQ10_008873 [Talaromyces amestolkiae]|uniref:Phosphoglycerate mutase family protein n=1 Tax=Talaromyces amestolkiae TaxID=1196081 RepID=A0A364LAX1_TALAM|nr:uncharacterized protein BHQ10_008873 [Talaromyces amestolkiae]RAO72861.1 hypothetical protein BHQ10_008873 [Talaromyces amestolkiae]
MPLDTIYLVRHGNRNNWEIDFDKKQYIPEFPTPTGNGADPTLNSSGVQQSYELASHISSPSFTPKPFRIYSSPFYRCIQTIQPTVEELAKKKQLGEIDLDIGTDLNVRVENGLGEWFGGIIFEPPAPVSANVLYTHFPTCLATNPESLYKPFVIPPRCGETLAQLHDRVAATLASIIAQADAEIAAAEAGQVTDSPRTSKAILISSHAAPLIAMGRALTGCMPTEFGEKDFNVFTAGLSTFIRRKPVSEDDQIVLGAVPDWKNGKGVGGDWECVKNSDTNFLSGGAESGWHFEGEASFDTSTTMAKTADSDTCVIATATAVV